MTCAESRARVSAIKRFPRASVCITSSGTRLGTGKTITYKGDCIIHKDRETLDWFYPAFASDRRSTQEGVDAYIQHLDSPDRVVIEFIPDWRLSFDSEALWERAPLAASDKDDPRNSGVIDQLNIVWRPWAEVTIGRSRNVFIPAGLASHTTDTEFAQ